MIFHSAARIQFFPLRAGQRSASDRQRAERERERDSERNPVFDGSGGLCKQVWILNCFEHTDEP